MPISVSDLSPVRQKLKAFVSPDVADFIVSETVDTSTREIPEFGTPHPNEKAYPNHLFCFAQPSVDEQGRMYRFYYAAPREDQDAYNFEFTQADIGGTRFDAVTRTYVTLRSEFVSTEELMGAAMPMVPADVFSGSYVLAEKTEKRTGDQQLDTIFIIEQKTYVKRVNLIQNDFDEFSGQNLATTQTLYYRGELIGTPPATVESVFANKLSSYWGIQSTGSFREGKMLSANWFVVSERDVLPYAFVTDGRSYQTTIDYSWPPVLAGIETMDWELRDGSFRNYPRPYYTYEGFSGPCKATVTETWSSSPQTPDIPETMQPLPIVYNSPMYAISVPSCLHGDVSVVADTGNTDPVFAENTGSSRLYGETSPATWPETVLASDTVSPFRGGYLRKRVVVSAPTTAPVIPA
jgi:hypothetical protein